MVITVEARTRCAMCGCWLPIIACPTVRINKRSIKSLSGRYLIASPGCCPECGTWAHGQMYRATAWRLTAASLREVEDHRARRWPETTAA